MAVYRATHTIEGFLAVEVAPYAYVTEEGEVLGRLSATKWGGEAGLEIVEYEGDATVEVDDHCHERALQISAVETGLREESAESKVRE